MDVQSGGGFRDVSSFGPSDALECGLRPFPDPSGCRVRGMGGIVCKHTHGQQPAQQPPTGAPETTAGHQRPRIQCQFCFSASVMSSSCQRRLVFSSFRVRLAACPHSPTEHNTQPWLRNASLHPQSFCFGYRGLEQCAAYSRFAMIFLMRAVHRESW